MRNSIINCNCVLNLKKKNFWQSFPRFKTGFFQHAIPDGLTCLGSSYLYFIPSHEKPFWFDWLLVLIEIFFKVKRCSISLYINSEPAWWFVFLSLKGRKESGGNLGEEKMCIKILNPFDSLENWKLLGKAKKKKKKRRISVNNEIKSDSYSIHFANKWETFCGLSIF